MYAVWRAGGEFGGDRDLLLALLVTVNGLNYVALVGGAVALAAGIAGLLSATKAPSEYKRNAGVVFNAAGCMAQNTDDERFVG